MVGEWEIRGGSQLGCGNSFKIDEGEGCEGGVGVKPSGNSFTVDPMGKWVWDAAKSTLLHLLLPK